MLALLPQILFLGALSATLLRTTLSAMIAYSAWRHLSHTSHTIKALGLIEIALGAALFTGAWTQAIAIITSFLLIIVLVRTPLQVWPRSTLALMLIISLTLIVTGPGAYAFDLPL